MADRHRNANEKQSLMADCFARSGWAAQGPSSCKLGDLSGFFQRASFLGAGAGFCYDPGSGGTDLKMLDWTNLYDFADWLSDNREWLFQGVGLSVTLMIAAALWKCVRVAGSYGFAALCMIPSVLRRLPATKSQPIGQAEPTKRVEVKSSLISATPEEVIKYRSGRPKGSYDQLAGKVQERYGMSKGDSERQVDDWMFGRMQADAPSRRSSGHACSRVSLQKRSRFGLTSLLIWIAVLNLVYLAVRWMIN